MSNTLKQKYIENLEQSLARLICERLVAFSENTGLSVQSLEVFAPDKGPLVSHNSFSQPFLDYSDDVLHVRVTLEE